MRERREFPIGVSGQTRKQGVVELYGVNSAGIEKSPQYVYFVMLLMIFIIVMFLLLINFLLSDKTENNLKDFCFVGQLDNKNCIFKIDTSSDILIVNKNLIALNKIKFKLNNCGLKYLMEEKIVVKEKVFVEVRLGKHI